MNTGEKKTPDKLISRRDFIKGSSTLVAGSLIACSLPIDNGTNLTEKTLKVALVGCGARGSGALFNAFMADKNIKLVALADVFPEQVDSCLKNLKLAFDQTENLKDRALFDDVAKFVGFDAYKKAIELADVVILATPPGFRPYHLEEAILKEKNVFCEKPVATDAAGVRKVLELSSIAEKKKLNVVVGLQRHYEKKYLEIIKRVHDGEIGQIISGQVFWDSGGTWVKERLAGQSEMEYQLRNWYYFNWLGGDHIVEQHVHNIDVFNWAKQSFPVSAKGIGGRQVRTGKEFGEIFDHHYVEFTYDDGTVLNSRCSHFKGSDGKIGECIIGTKGKAEFMFARDGWIKDYNGKTIYKHRERDDPDPYQTEHDELFRSIRAGNAINDLYQSANSAFTAIMGRYATYTGQVIKKDDLVDYKFNLMPESLMWDDLPPVLPDASGYYPVAKPGVTKFYKEKPFMETMEKALKKVDKVIGRDKKSTATLNY